MASTLAATPQRNRRKCRDARFNLDLIVTRFSQGELLDRLPRRRHRRWGQTVQVVVDRSERLVPYWADQDLVRHRLKRLYPRHAFQVAWMIDGLSEPVIASGRQRGQAYELPPSGTLVLILGDLGCLEQTGDACGRSWLRLVQRLQENGNRVAALVPCAGADRGPAAGRLPPDPLGTFRAAPPAGPIHRQDIAARAHRLLRLVSPAVRIEPGFSLSVRRLLSAAESEPGAEADVWQHPAIVSTSSSAATMDPDHAKRLRAEFDQQEDPEIRDRVLDLLARWRQGLPPEIYFEEILSLSWATRQRLPEDVNRAAEEFFLRLDDQWRGGEPASAVAACQRAWFGRVRGRADRRGLEEPRRGSGPASNVAGQRRRPGTRRPATRLRPRQNPRHSRPSGPTVLRLPSRRRPPVRLLARPAGAVRRRPRCAASPQYPPAGRPHPWEASCAPCTPRNGLIHVASVTRDAFWQSGQPPAWAVDWGEDEFGRWVAFEIAGVRQRMRWIEPGTFRMGSPEDEPGRYGEEFGDWNEGPQHEVTISRGFWLFDTACTQALWQAVMGDNPSRFQSPDRPVEQVSWEDCQTVPHEDQRTRAGTRSVPADRSPVGICLPGGDRYGDLRRSAGDPRREQWSTLDPIAWYAATAARIRTGQRLRLDGLAEQAV